MSQLVTQPLSHAASEARARWRPRVSPPSTAASLVAAARAASGRRRSLGRDIATAELVETPRRLVAAYHELLTGPDVDLTTFPNTEGYDELVLVANIPVRSVCEHHMLPFVGVAHVGYLPDERILGLSKFARLVDLVARRPQTQERLTTQVAEHLTTHLQPRGVGVVVEAEHTCMSLRGARAQGTRTVTSALRGSLRDAAARAEFLSLAREQGGRP